MHKEKITRINILAAKKRTGAITDVELAELQSLREQYLTVFRANLAATLENTYIQNKNGTVEKLRRKDTEQNAEQYPPKR